jgi:sugar fermentation stimulation protein A
MMSLPDHLSYPPIFEGALKEGVFLARPNRFVAICQLDDSQARVYMPNPGRLGELLVPGARLILGDYGEHNNRKTRYTVMAVHYHGSIIFLHTHLNNHVARALVESGGIPSLCDWKIIAQEVKHGHSRFDFLLRSDTTEMMLEVKSCTLATNGIAMFPDAITERGRRHLQELAELNASGHGAGVLFVIHHPAVTHFLPDYHSDLAFSETFRDIGDRLPIFAVSIDWASNLRYQISVPEVTIPWSTILSEVGNQGHVLAVLEEKDAFHITLSPFSDDISSGLRIEAEKVYPIRSSIDMSAVMVDRLKDNYGQPSKSAKQENADWDFKCPVNPIYTSRFQELLLSFRMPPRLTGEIPPPQAK